MSGCCPPWKQSKDWLEVLRLSPINIRYDICWLYDQDNNIKVLSTIYRGRPNKLTLLDQKTWKWIFEKNWQLTITRITINSIKTSFTRTLILSSFSRGRFTRSGFLVASAIVTAIWDTSFWCIIDIPRTTGAGEVRQSFIGGLVYGVYILTNTWCYITSIFTFVTNCYKKREIRVKLSGCYMNKMGAFPEFWKFQVLQIEDI